MLDYVLPYFNESVYVMMFWLFAYSIMGWLVESIYMSFCNRRITNRGFIHGPICPIYGICGFGVHMALRGLSYNYLILYIAGAILATSFEYITARLMIRVFGFVWWDYSNKPFNFRNIICLESTLAWGVYTVLEFAVFQRMVFSLIDRTPRFLGKSAVVVISIYFLIDLGICLLHAKRGELQADENNMLAFK